MKNKKINKCLLCFNKDLKSVFNLGNFYVSNFVKKMNIKNSIKCPLSLMYCKNCSLIQLSHIAPQELMYRRFYWYKSGVTKIMKDALKNIYSESLKHIKLKKNDVILDIGANDGTLLKYFKKSGYKTIGCEPANNLKKELSLNCDHVINNFWSYQELKKITGCAIIRTPGSKRQKSSSNETSMNHLFN